MLITQHIFRFKRFPLLSHPSRSRHASAQQHAPARREQRILQIPDAIFAASTPLHPSFRLCCGVAPASPSPNSLVESSSPHSLVDFDRWPSSDCRQARRFSHLSSRQLHHLPSMSIAKKKPVLFIVFFRGFL